MVEYAYPDVRLIIFARAPQAGQCKTRLIPALGEHGAARLHQELIENCLTRLCHTPLCPTELWCSPDTRHPYFQSVAENYALSLYQQQGGDLGEKMYLAMAASASPYTIIVGTDCPLLSHDYIEQAISTLREGCDAVIGPAEDGGYVLLGLRHVPECLFRGIAWGTGRVFMQTSAKLDATALVWRAIEPLWDVDEAGDLPRYRALQIAHRHSKA